jgi:hypothetical protein
MMNALLMSFGDGVMMGRIVWPVDGAILAVMLMGVFALLLAVLLHESKPTDSAIHMKPKGVRPLSGPLHYPHAA